MDVLRDDRVTLRELTAENVNEIPHRYAGDYTAFTSLWAWPPHPQETKDGA